MHRDLYLSEELFALEQEHFFANTWLYVGHASQVPNAGDYWSLELAGRPLMMVRQPDGAVRVLLQPLRAQGHAAGDATRAATPASSSAARTTPGPTSSTARRSRCRSRAGYEGTRLKECESGRGLTALKHVGGLPRLRLRRACPMHGPDFESYFGEVLRAIDNMVDRSPEGRLTVGGGVLRNIIHCNWKMYLENINDTVHPMSTHESATQAAEALWQGQRADEPKPMAMEQILPFGSGYDFFDRMGGRVFANGHSVLGVNFSIHSGYAQLPDYEAAMRAAHGAERAAEILQRSPQNSVLIPSLAVKGSPQAIRVIRPLAADRTLVEAWSFRAAGAPDAAVRARDDLQPAGVLADVGGRARRRAPVRKHPAGPARRRQRMGQPASQLRRRRARRRTRSPPTAPTSC